MITRVPPEQQIAVADAIETGLLGSLADTNLQATNTALVFAVHEADGALIGGVTGATSYGWLLVKTLWVHPTQRGAGLGADLMTQIEDAACAVGCHHAWLDTSNQHAQRFYQKRGYAVFGTLENGPDQSPPGHQRWFMKKALTA